MTKKNIYIFLFNGFSDWEISYLTPELQKSEKIELKYFSIDGKSIKSMGGMNITPEFSIDQVDSNQVSAIILPGGTAWENKSINGIDGLIEKLHAQNKVIGAICGATTYLAGKGYLDNLNHTSNALFYLQNFAKDYNGADNYINELAVTDTNLITANGIGPIEFAREVFKKNRIT
ncbi:type 1 glutamine amidotransferase family protein [Polaribacter sp. ALD11]|uniref:type 1 glutamine amidotransferase family protein n=1 Tax=Polaribacter sp. ALD11 TaxID=2058137 RepID=UPI0018E253A9|nr:type 1 glutamine amidotransferase family protein [Polaribacter sp. ALD11]